MPRPKKTADTGNGGGLKIEYRRVTLEFTEPLLGMTPQEAAVWRDWIRPMQERKALAAGQDIAAEHAEEAQVIAPAVKANPEFLNKEVMRERNKADAAAAADDEDFIAEEHPRQLTTFARDEHGPFLWNYQVLGHLKEMGNLAKSSYNMSALRKKIENAVIVLPRRVYIEGVLSEPVRRPLRAQTAKGQTVAIAESHAVLAGGRITFWLGLLPNRDPQLTWELLRDLLDWGEVRGLGQWRTAGWGTYEVIEWAEEDHKPPRYVKPVQGVPETAFQPLRWG